MPFVFGAGIFTPIIEAIATAIAAGVVVGGFLGASAGALNGWSRREVEQNALRDTHWGATAAFACWVADQCIVYITSI
jgi:hypothetical protein